MMLWVYEGIPPASRRTWLVKKDGIVTGWVWVDGKMLDPNIDMDVDFVGYRPATEDETAEFLLLGGSLE
jgi:hypothetical protein